MKQGDRVQLFNGNGLEADGEILTLNSKEVAITLKNITTKIKTTPRIILACAIPKKTKFEWIIEKATEFGTDDIIPMLTERTECNRDKEHLIKKHLRYEQTAINAAKQSKRQTIPIIHPIMTFKEALAKLIASSCVIIPSLEGERTPLIKALSGTKTSQPISFLIGPEGDFSKAEYESAFKQGCIPVSLGETTLKVETAAFSVLSMANLFFINDKI